MSEQATSVSWDFPGWGTVQRIKGLSAVKSAEAHVHAKLGTWGATAICGNDITSSCLYVSALCAAQAGAYAPIVLAIVAAVLYLFRNVYAEVGSALPLNGGTYTVLLNTTNKRLAAGAAALTLLSYVATAVISASEAMHYAHNLWEGINVTGATVGLLGFFAVLNFVGISESAVVALGIFIFHMVTLLVLTATGGLTVMRDPTLFSANWASADPSQLPHALFFGFAAAMLGISGFESSANFIEEQKDGVFPKTLRNMWLAVAFFNPMMSLLSLGLLPLDEIQQVPPDLLAQMGERSLGPVLRTWVSIDAVLVLSGAVLTSYVGVVGLMRRMSLDRCLPQFLLTQNKWRGTNHWIILSFFLVCVSILFATGGHLSTLAGVYTIAFLSVMAMFAVGNMLLKVKRGRLPRSSRAPWISVFIALAAVLTGLVGNLLLDPAIVKVFGYYFGGAVLLVGIMFVRVDLLRIVLASVHNVAERVNRLNRYVMVQLERIHARNVVYFTKQGDREELNRAALYVLQNEQSNHLQVVHVHGEGENPPEELAEHLRFLDRVYPNLRIDFVAVEGEFTPSLIRALGERLGVPLNYMFIGTPGQRFPHRVANLGGVRIIL